MKREHALALAAQHFDSGNFARDLARRVALRTESQDPASGPALLAYLAEEIGPSLAALGFTFTIHPNPEPPYGPLLVATRHEGGALPTVLMYGHGDVVRGQEGLLQVAARAGVGRPPKATGSTAAARPTTRDSTASISPRWPKCWRRARGGSAST